MRPDVATAFDAMFAAASGAGHALTINSAFRSDAEQAALFAANPDPRMVARPGTSLHRCGTELDLGPSSAYGWLAANAQRFGFVQRYSWEAWHYGYVRGPAPCSDLGERIDREEADGASVRAGLPSFVPARFREPIAQAASRWNVPVNVLAAQLLAESNFNPLAVSPAGASGIAQFMPRTAAAYGLARSVRPGRGHRRPGPSDVRPHAPVRRRLACARRLQRRPGARRGLLVRSVLPRDPGIRRSDPRADGRRGGESRRPPSRCV